MSIVLFCQITDYVIIFLSGGAKLCVDELGHISIYMIKSGHQSQGFNLAEAFFHHIPDVKGIMGQPVSSMLFSMVIKG